MKKHSDKKAKPVEKEAMVAMVAPGGGSSVELVHHHGREITNQKRQLAEDEDPNQKAPRAAIISLDKEHQQLKKRRDTLIENIKKALPSFIMLWHQICLWLEELRDNKSLHAPYCNFPELCREELDLGESTGYEYAKAGRVVRLLQDAKKSDTSEFSWGLPRTERLIKPLLKVKDDAKVVEIWAAANSAVGAGRVTEKVVREHRDKVIPREIQKPGLKSRREKLWVAIRKELKQEAAEERGGLIDEAGALLQGLRDELGGTTASKLREATDVEMILPGNWPVEQVKTWFREHNIADADLLGKLERPPDQQPWRITYRHQNRANAELRARLIDRVKSA